MKKLSDIPSEISPPPDTIVNFHSATAYVRDARILNHSDPIRLTSGHRGIRARLDIGYILVERAWFPPSSK